MSKKRAYPVDELVVRCPNTSKMDCICECGELVINHRIVKNTKKTQSKVEAHRAANRALREHKRAQELGCTIDELQTLRRLRGSNATRGMKTRQDVLEAIKLGEKRRGRSRELDQLNEFRQSMGMPPVKELPKMSEYLGLRKQ